MWSRDAKEGLGQEKKKGEAFGQEWYGRYGRTDCTAGRTDHLGPGKFGSTKIEFLVVGKSWQVWASFLGPYKYGGVGMKQLIEWKP